MKENEQHFNIGQAVKHFTKFRETGDIDELRKVNRFLTDHLKKLEELEEKVELPPDVFYS